MHATRTASKHKDDAEDEHGNVFEYCGQLFRYSLTPRTNAQYMKTIELCDVNGSPNTLQAIWGIPPLCHSATLSFLSASCCSSKCNMIHNRPENLGTPRWRQVSHSAFFPFPCKIVGRATLVHLARIFRGAPMSRR